MADKDHWDGSKPPSAQGLPPGFNWHFISGIRSMVPKKHDGKFKDPIPFLEDLFDNLMDDL